MYYLDLFDQIDWACFQMKKLNSITAIPMIDSENVGVKLPVSGTGSAEADAVGVADTLGVAVAFAVAVGVAVDADPDASKAGPSAA